jgi:uncharacterized protein
MKVWVLADNRIGSTNQAIAVANILGVDFELKKLDYNALSSIPNIFKFKFFGLQKKSIEGLISHDKPDIIISAGRRAASVAVSLKKLHENCKIIQILKPRLSLKYFDALILPEHDVFKCRRYSERIIKLPGAVTFYSKQRNTSDNRYWEPIFDKRFGLKKPWIVVFIGGIGKHCTLKVSHTQILFNELERIHKVVGGSLLISTSRRTPSDVEDFIKDNMKNSSIPYHLYCPSSLEENPYNGYLAVSDYIVSTADSISMISESLATSKPVYVFYRKDMLSLKHIRFIDNLVENGYVLDLKDFSVNKIFKSANITIKDKLSELLRI